MPHSSGGGSSSSGSHSSSSSGHSSSSSSSHSSSSHSSYSGHSGGSYSGYRDHDDYQYGGGSSGPNYKTKNHPFPGSKCFVYYRHHRPHYVYSNVTLNQYPNNNMRLRFRIAFGLVFGCIIFTLPLIWQDFQIYTESVRRLNTGSVYACTVNDNADLFTDEQENSLQLTLERFLETTGIPVAFYTDYNETWRSSSTSLEDYAYDLYVENFADEYHWVVIYTQGTDDSSDWYWEGVQGDYTGQVMDVFIDAFNSDVHSGLVIGEDTVAGVFVDAFEQSTEAFANRKGTFNAQEFFEKLAASAAVIAFFYLIVIFVPNQLPGGPYKNSELVQVKENTDSPLTEDCPYCGKKYVVSAHDACPHCGEKLPPQGVNL